MANREQRRAAAKSKNDDETITVTVDAVAYRFDPNELTSAIERELYTASGLTWAGIMMAFNRREFAPFMIAGLVFLARRSRGDAVAYEEIENSIGYDAEIDIDFGGTSTDEGEAPEVPAAD